LRNVIDKDTRANDVVAEFERVVSRRADEPLTV